MNEPSLEAMTTSLGWLVVSLLQGLHPAAASGAAFGCFFLLSLPDPDNRPVVRKAFLLMFSWGCGYAAGTFAAGSDGWGSSAMIVAVLTSATASSILGVANLMWNNNGPLPKWLDNILDRLPLLKPRNPNDPQ